MRHQKRIRKLGRTSAHRKATLAALSTALIEHKRITTTFVKAKALRSFVEPLINRAKEDTTHNRREVFRKLQNKESVKILFDDIADRITERSGGYTRVVKLGQRQGDGAEVAVIELVDYNDIKPDGAGGSRTKRQTRRSRRRKKSTSASVETAAPEVVDTIEEENTGLVEEAVEAITETVEDVVETVKETVVEAVETIEEAVETVVGEEDTPEVDDLTRIWGIGPKFAELLNNNGIHTFAQLAETDLETLRGMIEAGGIKQSIANEESWAEQARLAAEGDWEGIEALKNKPKDDAGE
jgi:large subunit ribosomal protein L17